jgi:hypothetical protein
MVETLSSMLPLQTKAPDFSLPDAVSDKTVSLAQLEAAPALAITVPLSFTCEVS